MLEVKNTKCEVKTTSQFRKDYKKILKQGKDKKKFLEVLIKLANLKELEPKYRNHALQNSRKYKNCNECHIEPDWLLVYQYINDNTIILLLVETGSHSDLF